jgi:phage shock protein C
MTMHARSGDGGANDGPPGPSFGNRLYRNPRRGMVFGVCAGIADYFGFDLTVTRVIVVIAAIFSLPIVFVAYLLLGLLLPRRPLAPEGFDQVDPVQRQVRSSPHDTLSGVRYRFRDLDARLQRLEKYVTSNRYKLDREFRQLKD